MSLQIQIILNLIMWNNCNFFNIWQSLSKQWIKPTRSDLKHHITKWCLFRQDYFIKQPRCCIMMLHLHNVLLVSMALITSYFNNIQIWCTAQDRNDVSCISKPQQWSLVIVNVRQFYQNTNYTKKEIWAHSSLRKFFVQPFSKVIVFLSNLFFHQPNQRAKCLSFCLARINIYINSAIG